ncbi:hypothetical protein K440DRAFT_627052 [Wilcoxina mikolae CBS 423.85]|nr:hypothetical protein K440DRAFT_627052 [Wilcoxina mikolae CBS 423.85]
MNLSSLKEPQEPIPARLSTWGSRAAPKLSYLLDSGFSEANRLRSAFPQGKTTQNTVHSAGGLQGLLGT